MASIFSITTATNNVPIGEQRRATVLFTVTNTSGQPLTGRGLLVMDPPHEAQAAWLRFKPPQESERHFDEHGVQDFTVEVNVSVDALAGDYLFHLDMLVTEDPDETYTAGPGVKLRVPAPEPPKRFPWWIIAVAVGVLAVIIGVAIFWPRRIEVPDVIGQPQDKARETVTAAGLAFQLTAEKHDTKLAGVILATTPQAGERVSKVTPVLYVRSLGQLPTPTFTPSPTVTPSLTPTPQLTIDDLSPNIAAADTTVIMTIAGTGFVNGAVVTFEGGQGKASEVAAIQVLNDTTMMVTVNVQADAAFGTQTWDVRVTNPNGKTAVLMDAFSVIP